MGAGGHGRCRGRADEHVATMRDKNANHYGYGHGYINRQLLTCRMIMEAGDCATIKNKSYLIMGRECRYLF